MPLSESPCFPDVIAICNIHLIDLTQWHSGNPTVIDNIHKK